MEEWARQTGAPWLILLDAFDEVPATERARLANWLDCVIPALLEHRVVVSARTSAAGQHAWEARFARHRVLPFTVEQSAVFAQNWFGDDAAGFLNDLERLRAAGLGGKVLLLTIAAKVYLAKRRLPDTRAQLYRECADTCLEEARLLGADEELGELEGPADLQATRLAALALHMTEHPGSDALDELGGFVSEYLVEQENLARGKARALGRLFVEVMARRSGVLVRREDDYEMVHPTFREFLAARAAALNWAPGSPEANAYVQRWTEWDWFEVVLFMFGLWNDAPQNVTPLLERMVDAEHGLRLAGAVLAEGVRVTATTEARIIERLLAAARDAPQNRHDSFNEFKVLARLTGRPRVIQGLLELARDDTLQEEQRLAALGALKRLQQSEEVGAILANLLAAQAAGFWDSDPHDSFLAARGIHSGYLLRIVGDAGLLDDVADNDRVDAGIRLRAAIKRVEWTSDYGSPDRAVDAIQALTVSADLDPALRLQALDAIEKLRPREALIPALRAVATDANARAVTRLLAARRLRHAGAAEEGESVLLSVALDPFAPPELRQQSAVDLGLDHGSDDLTPADVSRLIGYATDMRLSRTARYIAAMTAVRGPGSSDAVADMRAIARDRSAAVMQRTAAILALGFRIDDPGVDDIASVLETLASDATDETSWTALGSLAMLERPGRPATTMLAAFFREQGVAPMAVLTEEASAVLGDALAYDLIVRTPQFLKQPAPVDDSASETMRAYAQTRRNQTETWFRKLLLGPRPAPATSTARDPRPAQPSRSGEARAGRVRVRESGDGERFAGEPANS